MDYRKFLSDEKNFLLSMWVLALPLSLIGLFINNDFPLGYIVALTSFTFYKLWRVRNE